MIIGIDPHCICGGTFEFEKNSEGEKTGIYKCPECGAWGALYLNEAGGGGAGIGYIPTANKKEKSHDRD